MVRVLKRILKYRRRRRESRDSGFWKDRLLDEEIDSGFWKGRLLDEYYGLKAIKC